MVWRAMDLKVQCYLNKYDDFNENFANRLDLMRRLLQLTHKPVYLLFGLCKHNTPYHVSLAACGIWIDFA